MPYAVVRGARNTIVIPHVGRKIARRRWGVRGLGQDDGDVNITPGGIVQTGVDTGTSVNLFPGGSLPSNPVLTTPTSSSPDLTGIFTQTATPASVANANYLAPVASDSTQATAAGLISPQSSLSAAQQSSLLAMPSSTPISAAGLTSAQQAQLIAAGISTVGQLVASGLNPVSSVAVQPSAVSSNPFASISATGWILGGVALFAIVLVTSKKR